MTESIAIEIREALMAANEKFMAAFNQGNAAGLAALYTKNGQLLPAHSDFVTHQPAIQAFWQGAMDMGIKSARLETLEAEESVLREGDGFGFGFQGFELDAAEASGLPVLVIGGDFAGEDGGFSGVGFEEAEEVYGGD